MLISKHGQADWNMTGSFTGVKEYNGKQLAMVKLKGRLEMTLHKDETAQARPGQPRLSSCSRFVAWP